mgnify:CR=1 FL=1
MNSIESRANIILTCEKSIELVRTSITVLDRLNDDDDAQCDEIRINMVHCSLSGISWLKMAIAAAWQNNLDLCSSALAKAHEQNEKFNRLQIQLRNRIEERIEKLINEQLVIKERIEKAKREIGVEG